MAAHDTEATASLHCALSARCLAVKWQDLRGVGRRRHPQIAACRSSAAERYISRFVQAGFDDAKKRGLDGIVCGHIHRAALFERDGRVYANDGDWVESLTALAEDPDGTLRLLSHAGETLAMLPPRLVLTGELALAQAA